MTLMSLRTRKSPKIFSFRLRMIMTKDTITIALSKKLMNSKKNEGP